MSDNVETKKHKNFKQKQNKRKSVNSINEPSSIESIDQTDDQKQQKKVKTNLSNHGRDYSGDLEAYLTHWENRNNKKNPSDWKFSKVIQSWALQNCLNCSKIPTKVFELLVPYIATIQGGARDRILDIANAAIKEKDNDDDNDDEDNKDDDVDCLVKKRAIEILNILSNLNE